MKKQLFEIYENSKKFEETREYIKKLDNKAVNWFNMNALIDLIYQNYYKSNSSQDNNYTYIRLYIINLLEQRYSWLNNIAVKPTDANTVAIGILNELLENDKNPTARSELERDKYFIKTNTKNQVDKALKYFELYGLLSKYKIEINRFFKINTTCWFNQSKYEIHSNQILKEITPMIVSYIKNGNIETFNIEKFFLKLSEVIEFAIQPSSSHNEMIDLEIELLNILDTNLNENEKESIFLIYDNGINKEDLEIIPIKIIYKENEKFILCTDASTDEKLTLSLNNLYVDINTEEFNTNFNDTLSTSSMLSVDKNLTSSNIKEEDKNVEVILECDSVIYEYFKMKPLSNMTTYDEQNKLIEFMETYNQKINDNKFYVVASDTEDKIISIVLHTIENVKILEPSNLNDKLALIFKSYLDKTNIDICPKPSEPNNDKDQSENFSLSNNKNINTDNLEIIKDDKDLNLSF